VNDDIVTRLRDWHDQRDSWQTLTEAADEIERLRAIIAHTWKHRQGCGSQICQQCANAFYIYRDKEACGE